ncbi:MAG TPA: hypothetical protein VGO40_13935 [Longimicrobium sp.]|jgi:hypothetical protein|nr:hypothetical protein [Longimicrobium sp.]
MNSILQSTGAIEAETRRIAERGCIAIEMLRAEPSSERFQLAQELLLTWLLRVERRQTQLRKRRLAARVHPTPIERRVGRKPELGSIRQGHIHALKQRESALSAQANVIRQFGDACAWLLFGGDPCLVRSQYLAGAAHQLPQDLEGFAPFERMREIHQGGRFWVVANDLTRCFTRGDLTIVRAGHPGSVAINEEIKATLIEGSNEVLASINSVRSDDPEHSALHDEFGEEEQRFASNTELARDAREQRQLDRLGEGTKLALRLIRRGGSLLPHVAHWNSVTSAVERAQSSGGAFDFPEPGVAILALRCRPTDDPKNTYQQCVKEIVEIDERHLSSETRTDVYTFLRDPDLSSLVRPIPLWDIPMTVRVTLLAQEVFLGVSIASGTWSSAMQDAGVTWTEENGYWKCEWNGKKTWMSPLDVQAWKVGAQYGQVSPRQLAAQIRSNLEAFETESTITSVQR